MIEKAILHTLAYFACFSYPLTKKELFEFLYSAEKYSLHDFEKALHTLIQEKKIALEDGLYGLVGEGMKAPFRREKIWVGEEKLRKAKRAIRILQSLPFVEGIFLCNQFFISTRDESDIDLLIIAKKGRIWLVRFWSIVFMAILRFRIKKGSEKNKICLSFFATKDALNFEKIAIENDIYLHYWILTLVPFYDPSNLFSFIMEENKEFLKKNAARIPEEFVFHPSVSAKEYVFLRWKKIFWQWAWKGKFGDFCEAVVKRVQKWKLDKKYPSTDAQGPPSTKAQGPPSTKAQGPPSTKIQQGPVGDKKIVITDEMLKFHENDRRGFYLEKSNDVLKKIL